MQEDPRSPQTVPRVLRGFKGKFQELLGAFQGVPGSFKEVLGQGLKGIQGVPGVLRRYQGVSRRYQGVLGALKVISVGRFSEY